MHNIFFTMNLKPSTTKHVNVCSNSFFSLALETYRWALGVKVSEYHDSYIFRIMVFTHHLCWSIPRTKFKDGNSRL